MTVADWLERLSPEPPAALAARLKLALRPHLGRRVEDVPEACLDAGELLLAELLSSGVTSRDTALDLLTVDALVTYAFESASEHPETFEMRAAAAMARFATVPQHLRA